ncbi:hypothetical protein [Mycoplasma todarodis]|uniref:hypothetical protein n=1 Tax=Mycoplasma todarodis TaxID=1937191 RepID=UPI003B31A47E
MKLNKKILLRGAITPLVIATPVVVAVSCGNSIANQKGNDKKQNKIIIPKGKVAQSYTAAMELNNYFGDFLSKFKGKVALTAQAKRTADYAIIAFVSYLESDATNSNADEKAKAKAKQEFSENLKEFKDQLDKLFDMALVDPENSANIISPIINNFINLKDVDKSNKAQRLAKVVIQNVLLKMQMVMDNVLDTLININYSDPTKVIGDAELVGTLKDVQDGKTNKLVSNDDVKAGFADAKKIASGVEISKEDTYDIKNHLGGSIGSLASIFGGLIGDTKFKVETDVIKGTPWQAGMAEFVSSATAHPEDIKVYKSKTTDEIYFKKAETTTHLANNIKKSLNLDESNVGALIDDPFLNDNFLVDLFRTGDIKIPSLGKIKQLLNDKTPIYNTLNKIQLILEDFGKTLELTEVNLQMLASHLIGDKAEFYGGIEKKNGSWEAKEEAFMTPQLNAYNYSNYEGYNKHVKQDVIDNSLKIVLQKTVPIIGTVEASVNVLDVLKNITRDPHSNYTVGLFQIAQVLTEGLKKEGMNDIKIKI